MAGGESRFYCKEGKSLKAIKKTSQAWKISHKRKTVGSGQNDNAAFDLELNKERLDRK